ncbi:hypothetical protein CRUP_019521, partial [Coryphaenoides rupestris]
QFLDKAVSYHQFSSNPSLIDDPNLVVRLGHKYYNWSTAAPLMLAMQVYQKPLPQVRAHSDVIRSSRRRRWENLLKDRMPKKEGGRFSWFSWRSRNRPVQPSKETFTWSQRRGRVETTERPSDRGLRYYRMNEESSSSDDDQSSANQRPGACQLEPLIGCSSVCYKKDPEG